MGMRVGQAVRLQLLSGQRRKQRMPCRRTSKTCSTVTSNSSSIDSKLKPGHLGPGLTYLKGFSNVFVSSVLLYLVLRLYSFFLRTCTQSFATTMARIGI